MGYEAASNGDIVLFRVPYEFKNNSFHVNSYYNGIGKGNGIWNYVYDEKKRLTDSVNSLKSLCIEEGVWKFSFYNRTEKIKSNLLKNSRNVKGSLYELEK